MKLAAELFGLICVLLFVSLAGCERHEVARTALEAKALRVSSVSHVGGWDDTRELVTVWGYAEAKDGTSKTSGRSLLELSARAHAQELLTFASGVSLMRGTNGPRFTGESMVSMVIKDVRVTATNCLVEAVGRVLVKIPTDMKNLRSVVKSTSMAKSQLTFELLDSAKQVLDEARLNGNDRDGFLVLRKMSLLRTNGVPECSFELNVYGKER